MTGEFMTKRLKQRLRSSMAGGLAFCLAFSGVPGQHSPTFLRVSEAEAQSASIVRITESGSGTRKRLNLGLNKALVIDLPEDAHDILVADPSLADAVTRTSRRIYLFGKTVGQTNIFIFGENGREIVSIDLEVERDISGLEANIRRFIPESDIKVEIVSDNIVLTGSVRTPQDSARAVQLADAFLKGGEATTRNISLTGGDNGGDAAIFAERRQVSQIVNMLTIEGEDQVTLKVTVAEVSRQVLKQLGFNGSISSSTSGNGFEFANPTNLGSAIDSASRIASGAIGSGSLRFASYLNAMEQAGVMRTLAEPSLTAISGEQAKFYVGGDFRIAAEQDVSLDKDTNSTVVKREMETVDYGITLNFKPVVLSPGRISLKIETNVSEPTYEGNVVTGNYGRGIPGSTYMSIRKRETSTTVELPSGGSIVIAGLVQDNVRQAMSGLPGISKIPIFGTLFRSKDFLRNETELVIIATPYLVRPVARNQIARPDDNFNPENDAAMYFMNRVNKVYGRKDQVQAAPYQGSVGFIYK
ncbi:MULTISPECIES: type II and III secretion system protein family protein [unclassified Agrobacterium]|jgi:pilus assembly protein CpaC|uniref:Pilus assembly protein CpaC n=1 Tax=Agrobacterium fabrum TaxID=1176649 RepID=A0A2W5FG29_9HYPH|nr:MULTISPECIES: type II and III secretion system protein family protein [unclassified Agrobacterium]PZP52637.1 MAG: pilus assembly protein CpaC [Agrobacterium fabrum]MDH0612808.1 type II and III secretion system protein family protein [Agrobacterium sp. GD03872]MDH0694672.1 type II and III secretion system protein family protein [Agrobacterium sp. GD03871]MDH1057930.1 type II and III secretion system protein family protein [Agrobacterium sp. GD03992]MDH2209219.1 type II and III secretion syst